MYPLFFCTHRTQPTDVPCKTSSCGNNFSLSISPHSPPHRSTHFTICCSNPITFQMIKKSPTPKYLSRIYAIFRHHSKPPPVHSFAALMGRWLGHFGSIHFLTPHHTPSLPSFKPTVKAAPMTPHVGYTRCFIPLRWYAFKPFPSDPKAFHPTTNGCCFPIQTRNRR